MTELTSRMQEYMRMEERKYYQNSRAKPEAWLKRQAYMKAYYQAHKEERKAYQRNHPKTELQSKQVTIYWRIRYRHDDEYREHRKAVSKVRSHQKRARRILPPIIGALLQWNERRQT